MMAVHFGHHLWPTTAYCTQLTKAYVAKTSCNQLLLLD